jgi:hypothetical protein
MFRLFAFIAHCPTRRGGAVIITMIGNTPAFAIWLAKKHQSKIKAIPNIPGITFPEFCLVLTIQKLGAA